MGRIHTLSTNFNNKPIARSQLQVRQLCHLERFRQTTGHAYCSAALRGMGVSNYVMTTNRKIRS